MLKVLLMLCSAIPLSFQSPYLLSAWRSSRLDQWDWIFFIMTVPAAFFACRKEKPGKCDWKAFFLLVPSLLAVSTLFYHKINALAAASSAAVIFSAAWLLFSWSFACSILPAAVILLLGTPSSSYAVSLLLMCPVWTAWLIKFLAAAACFALIFSKKRCDVQLNTLCFTAAVLGSCCLLLHSKEIYFEGKSFIPVFSGHVGNYWGRSIEPDENTKRFFVSSTVKQYRYTGNDADISVLSVKCGYDIHEIHPAGHCLRTSRWTVNSEKTLYLQDNFAVTEIDAEKGADRYLIWVWYSSDKFSTPGFLGFRRHFRSGGNYYTCQISTPVLKDAESSRDELDKFLKSLKQNDSIQSREPKQ